MIVTTLDVFCDNPSSARCTGWTQGVTGSGGNARLARRRAKAEGWTRRKINDRMLDLCPDCSKETT